MKYKFACGPDGVPADFFLNKLYTIPRSPFLLFNKSTWVRYIYRCLEKQLHYARFWYKIVKIIVCISFCTAKLFESLLIHQLSNICNPFIIPEKHEFVPGRLSFKFNYFSWICFWCFGGVHVDWYNLYQLLHLAFDRVSHEILIKNCTFLVLHGLCWNGFIVI